MNELKIILNYYYDIVGYAIYQHILIYKEAKLQISTRELNILKKYINEPYLALLNFRNNGKDKIKSSISYEFTDKMIQDMLLDIALKNVKITIISEKQR